MKVHYFQEPPSANRWWRNFRGRMVLSEDARNYKMSMAMQFIREDIITFPIHVEIYWMRKIKSGDLDKRIGILLDAMQGIFYANDSQIVSISAKRYDPEEHCPVAGMKPGWVAFIVIPADWKNGKGIPLKADNKTGEKHEPKRKIERAGKNGVGKGRDKGFIARTGETGARQKDGSRWRGIKVRPIGGK